MKYATVLVSLFALATTVSGEETEVVKMVKHILSDINRTLHQEISELKGQLSLTNANLSSLRKSLLAEWVPVGTERSRVFTTPQDWQTANETCAAFPARLIRIRGSKNNEEITKFLSTQANSLYWIGEQLSLDFSTDQKFHRLSKTTRCVAIDKTGTWMGRECTDSLPFICSIDI